ncbi:hypothetical protein COCMIDRAFT_30234 [Bipolaris oryzae ATCC 44560]|uniref:Uncharacterized protein n=1 Tax=Bipolaris oryzae ATCC 44560 TaxID=930090 RepID=W6ZB25_COCMI|nr:uncharacterized protein COCMIDRAFT_30234 [Bipolaris oryzae ATCC 44560]EUC40926.1 hypothetical protein COCMIDRAFT_30234 [Bipolaris oryzae ATCC 44560]
MPFCAQGYEVAESEATAFRSRCLCCNTPKDSEAATSSCLSTGFQESPEQSHHLLIPTHEATLHIHAVPLPKRTPSLNHPLNASIPSPNPLLLGASSYPLSHISMQSFRLSSLNSPLLGASSAHPRLASLAIPYPTLPYLATTSPQPSPKKSSPKVPLLARLQVHFQLQPTTSMREYATLYCIRVTPTCIAYPFPLLLASRVRINHIKREGYLVPSPPLPYSYSSSSPTFGFLKCGACARILGRAGVKVEGFCFVRGLIQMQGTRVTKPLK